MLPWRCLSGSWVRTGELRLWHTGRPTACLKSTGLAGSRCGQISHEKKYSSECTLLCKPSLRSKSRNRHLRTQTRGCGLSTKETDVKSSTVRVVSPEVTVNVCLKRQQWWLWLFAPCQSWETEQHCSVWLKGLNIPPNRRIQAKLWTPRMHSKSEVHRALHVHSFV